MTSGDSPTSRHRPGTPGPADRECPALLGHLGTGHGLLEDLIPRDLDGMTALHEAMLTVNPGSRRATCAPAWHGIGPEPVRVTVIRQAIRSVLTERVGARMVTGANVQSVLEGLLDEGDLDNLTGGWGA
jgi:hypothetical protein